MLTKLYHLHALSALHVGTGQAIGAVDLPIARAKGTHLPLVPGSALKGVSRDAYLRAGKADTDEIFGPQSISKSTDAFASALAFGDAHLLLLPVRSLAGVMAWVSCHFVLTRYRRDLLEAGVAHVPAQVPKAGANEAVLAAGSALKIGQNEVVFDDLDLVAAGTADPGWAEFLGKQIFPNDADARRQVSEHFAIISDDNFAFLAETATEIRARIAIDRDRGVVAKGQLWYEENLPAESVLWGLLGVDASRGKQQTSAEQVWKAFASGLPDGTPVQIGGKATVGRGLVRFLKGA